MRCDDLGLWKCDQVGELQCDQVGELQWDEVAESQCYQDGELQCYSDSYCKSRLPRHLTVRNCKSCKFARLLTTQFVMIAIVCSFE